MHAYIHTEVHAYTSTCIPTFLHTCVLTRIPTYLHTYLHTHVRTCTNTYLPASLLTVLQTCIQTRRQLQRDTAIVGKLGVVLYPHAPHLCGSAASLGTEILVVACGSSLYTAGSAFSRV